MKKTIAKDTPLAEITLRRYEKPSLQGRDLVRKLCLSLGILQPGDSRDVIVDVLYVLLKAKKEMDSQEIEKQVIASRKQHNLPQSGIAASNIRRQLKRLKDIFLIESVQNNYRIAEKAPLTETFEEKLEKFLVPSIMNRIREYFEAIDKEFK